MHKLVSICGATAFAVVASLSVPAQVRPQRDLVAPLPGLQDPHVATSGSILRGQPIFVDIGLLTTLRPDSHLRIELFPDVVFDAHFVRREILHDDPTRFNWHGTLAGSPSSQFILSVYRDAVAGWFFAGTREHPNSFTIQGAPGMLCAREIVQQPGSCGCDDAHLNHQHSLMHSAGLMPRGGGIGTSSLPGQGGGIAAGSCDDNPDQIDVLFAFTVQARLDAGGYNQANAEVQSMLANANTVLANSRSPLRFNDAYVTEVPTHAGWSMSTQLDHLTYRVNSQQDPNGLWDELHDDRLTFNADLVALIVHDDPAHGNVAGIGWTARSASFGFSITQRTSLGNYTLAHELGHNLGCYHDRGNSGTNHAYAHGYWDRLLDLSPISVDFFTTVMSYSQTCGSGCISTSTRIPYFSNQRVRIDFGFPYGIFDCGSSVHDNERRIREERQAVANYSRTIQGWDRAPNITSQPSSTSVDLGYNDPRILMTCDSDTGTVYQWRRDGVDIPGQTNRSLMLDLSDVTASMAGTYTCRVRGPGPCTSLFRDTQGATLTVGPTRVTRSAIADRGGVDDVVERIGDVDGDRIDDFVILRPESTLRAGFSSIVVHSGSTKQVLHTLELRGRVLSAAGGDVDGDGFEDLMMMQVDTATGNARAYWRDLRRSSWQNVRGFSLPARVGRTIAVGPIDADEAEEIVLQHDNWVIVYSMLAGTRLYLWGVDCGSVAADLLVLGDVNGDGFGDVVVGLPEANGGAGEVRILSGRNGSVLHQIPGQTANEAFGAQLAPLGDVDGDRVPDFAVSSPGHSNNRGLVTFWRGQATFIAGTFGPSGGVRFGEQMDSAGGDVEGDGFNDLLVGDAPATGTRSVFTLSGQTHGFLGTPLERGDNAFGTAFAGLVSDGDDSPDVVVLQPGASESLVWVFDERTRAGVPGFTRYGASCPKVDGSLPRIGGGNGTSPDPVQGIRARIGRDFRVFLDGAPAFVPAQLIIAVSSRPRGQISLGLWGSPNCYLWVGNSVIDVPGSTDGGGTAVVRIPLPNDVALVGDRFTFQWLTIDPAATPAPALIGSDALDLTIGARL